MAFSYNLLLPTSPQSRATASPWERQVASSSHPPSPIQFQERGRLTSSTQPPCTASFSNPRTLGLWLFSQRLAHKGEVLCQERQAKKSEATTSLQYPIHKAGESFQEKQAAISTRVLKQWLRFFSVAGVVLKSCGALPKWTDFNWKKSMVAIYGRSTANIILSGEMLKTFPLRSGTRQGCAHSHHSYST